eukprot:TRINITY_DN6472_c0_g3_i2.p1 TRINITY_DN6472_c0_g3~~TRINITY_DN6472_c0_g3_i2.p1  ORF type:complete len:319 (-),score=37.89 TRINITY_DN6472_c0_g3_i2:473-1345(-)
MTTTATTLMFAVLIFGSFWFCCEAIRKPTDRSVDANPPVPTIAAAFVDLNCSWGQTWYDSTRKLLRTSTTSYRYGYSIDLSEILTEDAGYVVQNGLCRPTTSYGVFIDLFSWVPYATYQGWEFDPSRGFFDIWSYDDYGVSWKMTSIGNTPLSLTHKSASVYFDVDFSTAWTPTTFVPANVSIIALPSSCNALNVCPSGPVVNQTLYSLGDESDYNVASTNVGDLMGYVAYACFLMTHSLDTFDLITEYLIEVVATPASIAFKGLTVLVSFIVQYDLWSIRLLRSTRNLH